MTDPECSACRNLLDLQRVAAISTLDKQIAADQAAGNRTDVDDALDRRFEIMESLRTGPHA